MPRRLPAVYDPVNGKLYGEDPIAGLLEVAIGGGGGGGSVTINSNAGDVFTSVGSEIFGVNATADKIVFWDQSGGELTYLDVGGGLQIIGTTLSATIQGAINLTVDANIGDIFSAVSSGYNAYFTADSAGSDKLVFWDQSASKLTYLTVGSGLSLSGTTLSATTVSTGLVTDTTPQLGGDLDVNGRDIISTNNGNIDLDPHGSGSIVAKGNSTRGSGEIVLNCEVNSHGVTVKGPPHSANATYTLTLPPDAGTNTYLLQTNGSGTTSWVAPPLGVKAISETAQIIDTDYTLSSGKNGHSVGPVEIANNYTVTIPNNATWLVS